MKKRKLSLFIIFLTCIPLVALSQEEMQERGKAVSLVTADSVARDTTVAYSKQLDGVTVTAKHIINTPTGYKALIASEKMFKSHSLLEAINMLPGLFVEKDRLKAYGENVSAVYLNGKRLRLSSSQLNDYLHTLEAKNIASVEVENPDADRKLIDGGGYILKIQTRRQEQSGQATFALDGSAGNETRADITPSVNLFRTIGKVSYYVYTRYNPTSYIERDSRSTADYFLQGQHREEEQTFSMKSRNTTSYAGGIGYDFNSNHSIAVNASGSYANRDVHHSTLNRFTGEEATKGEVNTHYRDNTNIISTDYRGSIGKVSLTGYAYAAVQSRNNVNTREVTSAGDVSLSELYQHLKKQVVGFSATAWWKISKKQSAAVSVRHADWNNTTDASQNNEKASAEQQLEQYRYKEHDWNAIAGYTRTIGKWRLKANVEWSHTAMRAHYEQPISKDYDFWLPTASVRHTFNEEKGHFAELLYYRSYTLPPFEYQSPNATWQSEYEKMTGNPVVEPDVTDHVTLRMQFFGLTLNGHYSYNKGLLRSYSAQSETGVIQTFIDEGNLYHQLYLTLAMPTVKPCKGWMISSSVFYKWNHQTYDNQKNCYSQTGLNLTSMNDLPGDVSLTISARMATASRDLFVKYNGMFDLSGSLSRSFLKSRLNVSLRSSLSTITKTTFFSPTFQMASEYVKPSFTISLSARYTLGWGKGLKRVNQNQESNLQRL